MFDSDVLDGSMGGFQEVLGRGRRERYSGHMADLIASELMGSDEDGEVSSLTKRKKGGAKSKSRRKPANLRTGNSFSPLPVEECSDADDNDYISSGDGSSTSSSDSDIQEITNEEVQWFQKIA